MAIFRKLHVSFWSDIFISGLTPEQRYFYLYILTNDKTCQCGIYEISKRQMSFDTGYSIPAIEKLIAFFTAKGKIKYDERTNEMAVKNWLKYNDSTSPKVKACVSKELKNVKNTVLIEYLNSIDTSTQEEQEQDPEEEQEQDTGDKVLKGQLFETFWNMYGKKNERWKCEAKFMKLKLSDIYLIIERLPAYILQTPEIKYRKNPSTWLNNKCWLDEIEPPKQLQQPAPSINNFSNEKEYLTYCKIHNLTPVLP